MPLCSQVIFGWGWPEKSCFISIFPPIILRICCQNLLGSSSFIFLSILKVVQGGRCSHRRCRGYGLHKHGRSFGIAWWTRRNPGSDRSLPISTPWLERSIISWRTRVINPPCSLYQPMFVLLWVFSLLEAMCPSTDVILFSHSFGCAVATTQATSLLPPRPFHCHFDGLSSITHLSSFGPSSSLLKSIYR